MNRKAKTPWVDASKKLPPEGQYVLIHLVKDNWHDHTDPKGVLFKVAKLERGITLAQREKMKAGKLPNPVSHGWLRSLTYTGGDENANNLRPYCWRSFGPGDYFGQEVDRWMHIPPSP